jgi:hypothetical protein
MKSRSGLAIILLGLTLAGTAQAQGISGEIVINQAPPPVRVEQIPPPPGPSSLWVWHKGHWRWIDSINVWVPGHWVKRPTPAAVWVEPQWVPRGNGWVFVEGHWQ